MIADLHYYLLFLLLSLILVLSDQRIISNGRRSLAAGAQKFTLPVLFTRNLRQGKQRV